MTNARLHSSAIEEGRRGEVKEAAASAARAAVTERTLLSPRRRGAQGEEIAVSQFAT